MLEMWHASGHFLEIRYLLHFYLPFALDLIVIIKWHPYNELLHSLMHEDDTHPQILHGLYYPAQRVEVG